MRRQDERTQNHIRGICRALVRYVEQDLIDEGAPADRLAVAKQLDVSKSMVQQVLARQKAFAFEKIVKYAAKTKRDMGKLLLDLARRAAEDEGGVPNDRSYADWEALAENIHGELQGLGTRGRRAEAAGSWDSQELYKRALARGFTAFREAGVPAVAVALHFQGDRRREFLVSNQPSTNGVAKVVTVDEAAPAELLAVVEGCRNGERIGDAVEVLTPEKDSDPKSEAFWEKVLGDESSVVPGGKVGVWVEQIFRKEDGRRGDGSSYSVDLVFVYESGFSVPEPIRKAMSALWVIISGIHTRDLERQVWIRPPGLLADASRREREAGVRDPVLSGVLDTMCRKLWADKGVGSDILRAQFWSFDYVRAEFVLLLEREKERRGVGDRGYEQGSLRLRVVPVGAARPEWGPESEVWREMTGFVLGNELSVVCNQSTWGGWESPAEDAAEDHKVLGLPVKIRHPDNAHRVHTTVLYLWCGHSDWKKAAECISVKVSQSLDQGGKGPGAGVESCSSPQQQALRVTARRLFSEIDQERDDSSVWRVLEESEPRALQEV